MKNTVIFDLDGTLCDITHRLHFIQRDKKDWDQFYLHCVFDEPKKEIIHLFHSLQNNPPVELYIVSGRNDKVKKETLNWLNKYKIYPDKLIMRPEGDYTPDDQLKRSWLISGLLGIKQNILFCVDDRQRVVDMWRKEGLTCLQVEAWNET